MKDACSYAAHIPLPSPHPLTPAYSPLPPLPEMRFSQAYMRSSIPDAQIFPRVPGRSDIDNKAEWEALCIVAARLLQVLLATSVLVLLIWWLPSHQASATEIAVYVMLGLNAVVSRHQLALLTVKSVANSGMLGLLTRYFPARRVAAAWRYLEAISAALASVHFLGGLVAAFPNAVEHVKRQRLEEILAEERKTEMLQERSYNLIH